MSQSGQACKSGERQQSATILELHPQCRGFARLPHCIIRYNLSGVVNRRLIGGDRAKLGDFHLTFLLIEARHYEHARFGNRIHRR
jgi:hypothetical protein